MTLFMPPECDALCPYRRCYSPGEKKGTFTPWRGYTSYYKKPITVCMTRCINGCPPGPLVGDRLTRPIPDMEKLLRDFKAGIDGMKASQKAKRAAQKPIDALRLLAQYFNVIAKG